MFTNVGRKIKVYAKIAFWFMTVSTLLVGIIALADAYFAEEYVLAVSIIIGGPITAWVISIFMYGFGELVEKVCNIERTFVDTPGDTENKSKVESFVDDVNDRVVQAAKALTKSTSIPETAKHAGTPVDQYTPTNAGKTTDANANKLCSGCGTELSEDSKFCTKCGTKVVFLQKKEQVCPSCGKSITEGNVFCTQCGHKISEIQVNEGEQK